MGVRPAKQLQEVLRNPDGSDLCDAAANLISRLLAYVPSERPSAADAMKDAFFDGYNRQVAGDEVGREHFLMSSLFFCIAEKGPAPSN